MAMFSGTVEVVRKETFRNRAIYFLSPTSIVQRYNNRLEGYFFIEEKIYRREWHDPEKAYNISKALTGHNVK